LFEHEEDKLEFNGGNSECSSNEKQSSGNLISTEIINLSGEYDASEQKTDTHAVKECSTGKGATCFKRESAQHLNEIRGQNLPAPLEGREIISCAS
jgi:hypothetical protein